MSKAPLVNTGTQGKGTAEKAVKEAGEKTLKCQIPDLQPISNLESRIPVGVGGNQCACGPVLRRSMLRTWKVHDHAPMEQICERLQ